MKIKKILGTLFFLLLAVVLVSCSKKTFEVVFYDWDNTVLDTQKVEEGSVATAPKNPTREGYDFLGWNKEYTNITEDIEITATYQINTYTIVWKNHDGSVLATDSNIEWGSTPSYGGTTPTKAATAEFDYTFIGWSPTVEVATSNQEYVAQFSETIDNMTYVYYGTYPQTVVDDSSLISSLNSLNSTNASGYYEFEGEEYAKVVAHPAETGYQFINGSTIQSGQTYYFKVEPIKWRVLEEADGTYTLLSEYIIDKQVFYTSNNTRTIGDQTIYANNYEHSTIREWLNNAFYNKAFSTLVDNSASTTESSTNPYFSNNTMDKVYLLSYQEARSSTYGFSTSTGSSSTRTAVTTDYARAVGAYMNTSTSNYGNGCWWLRSPINDYSNYAHFVYYDGIIYSSTTVDYSFIGARPAIKID